MLNSQKPEPRVKDHDGMTLDVVEIFHTIQGEGPFAGHSAVFIRLAGCNLQCPWCDTQYTEGRHSMMLAAILNVVRMRRGKASLVVITGGEPLRQNIAPLCATMLNDGFTVQIESNGVFPVSAGLARLIVNHPRQVNLVVSPKTSRIHDTMGQYACAFKYVIQDGFQDPDDGLPTVALGHTSTPRVARPPKGYKGPIYVNPMDSKDPQANSNNMGAAVVASLKHGHILGLQIHKIIDLP